MEKLTKRQNDVLTFVKSYIVSHGYPPTVREIGKDYSFELNIIVKKEKQGVLFHEILNMKRTNEIINEININMESLENILTNL